MAEEKKGKNSEAAAPSSFEENLKRLEAIVQQLEEGKPDLDDSLRLYEQGIKAYQRCQQLLSEAELKVRKLVQTLEGELEEEPFEPPQE